MLQRSLIPALLSGSLLGTSVFAANIPRSPAASLDPRAFVSGSWGLTQPGTTGVSAMQLAVTSESTAIILDK
ncbi:hypothetical protein K435DRAFT_863039, partial [Dendrothele bispora CBS 962.96]